MHIPITVNILSNDDNIKLNILNYLIRGILLLILVFSDVVSAENILPLADSFSGSLEKIFKDRFINYSIIKDLHTVEPVLRMEYQDLCLLDFQSANLFGAISGRTRGFSIIYPFLKHQQKATLSLSYKSTDNRMNMGSVQKKTLFSYQDRFKETRIQFSHFSDFFNLRWGIGLRLLEMDSDLETDPSLELEWGNISNLRIRLIVYQHSALIPQLWILRDESLKGDLHFQIDGFNAELLFGDVFGT
ncbi:hypothetical protein H8D57_02000, partial [bacterium]|nr:hypothetical protein [bacterium]